MKSGKLAVGWGVLGVLVSVGACLSYLVSR